LKLIRSEGHWAVDLTPWMDAQKEAADQTVDLAQLKQVGLTCQHYLHDHGKLPGMLDELFPKYLPNRSLLSDCVLTLPNTPAGSFTDKQVILRSTKPMKSGRHAEVYGDYSGAIPNKPQK
jgi:hypothetical protein